MKYPLNKEHLPALMALREESERVDSSGIHADEADLQEEFTDPKLDTERNTVGVWQNGQLVAYAMLYDPERVQEVMRFETAAAVHPDWRRQGLGKELVGWMRARARAIQGKQHGDVPGELLLSGVSTNTGLAALAQSTGFAPCRYWFSMTYDLRIHPEQVPAPPQGLRLVPFETTYDEAVRLAHNEAFKDHWGFAGADESDWRVWGTGSRSFRAEPSALLLDADGRVAAYLLADEYAADNAATGKRSCTVAFLGTLASHRGRGAARTLLTHALGKAQRLGYDQVELVVDTASATGALGLYQDVGFTVERTFVTYAAPLG